MIKCIIAGGRDFNNYPALKAKMDFFLGNSDDVTIISGGARGADKLGEFYAAAKNFEIEIFLAEWDKHGKSAGYKRNVQMANAATHCVVFWDGQSRGSSHMIDIAREAGLKLRVVHYTVSE